MAKKKVRDFETMKKEQGKITPVLEQSTPVDLSSKTTPVPVKTKVNPLLPAPDVSCPDCKGLGILYKQDGSGKTIPKKCKCLLRKEIRFYLTPLYADAPYVIDEVSFAMSEGKDLLLQGRQSPFKAFVKSFLLSTGAEYSHATVSAADLFQTHFNSAHVGMEEWNRLLNVDILILYLAYDTPNRTYGDIILSVMEKRNFNRKATWVYSDKPYLSEVFQRMYTKEFVDYLKERLSLKTIHFRNLTTEAKKEDSKETPELKAEKE